MLITVWEQSVTQEERGMAQPYSLELLLQSLHDRCLSDTHAILSDERFEAVSVIPHETQRALDRIFGIQTPPGDRPTVVMPTRQLRVIKTFVRVLPRLQQYLRLANLGNPREAYKCGERMFDLINIVEEFLRRLVLGAETAPQLSKITAKHLGITLSTITAFYELVGALGARVPVHGRFRGYVDDELVGCTRMELEIHITCLVDALIGLIGAKTRQYTRMPPDLKAERISVDIARLRQALQGELDQKFLGVDALLKYRG